VVNRHWIKTASLAASLLATTIVLADPTNLTPTDVNGPKFDPRAEEAGAYSINDRTGTVAYNYKFKLPPGRGVAPELMLSYSSAGPVRGGVAQGWDVAPLPAIKRDVSRGLGTQTEFTATFGGSILELAPAFGYDAIAHGGLAFRAKIDTSFTRFEQWNCSGSFSGMCWTAYTLDGRVHEFTEFLPGDWKLTTVTDAWGNHERYIYDPVYWSNVPVDYDLREIQYTYGPGGDSTSGIPPHAKVVLDHNNPETTTSCQGTDGLRLPAGAAVNYRTGAREITGLRRLTAVRAQVRDVALDTAWRDVHQWTIRYRPQAENCALASPRRQISSIEEVGIIRNTAGQDIATPGPTVTFQYGREAKSTPTVPTDISLPAPPPPSIGNIHAPLGLSDTSCPDTPTDQRVTYSMMADVDGDGLPDLIRTDGVLRGPAGGGYCLVYWNKNLGGGFETEASRASQGHEIRLPAPSPVTSALYSAGCGLNMAWKDRYSVSSDDNFCTVCTSDSQCGGTSLCVNPTVDSDESVCLIDCSGGATCPTGTSCRVVTSVSGTAGRQCVPNNGTCPGVPRGPHCDSSSNLVSADRRIYRWVDIDGDGKIDVITEGNVTSPPTDEAQLCTDPACALNPSNPSFCQPVPCAVAGATQVPEIINAPTDGTQFSPPTCAIHPIHISEPTCANGYSWNILFNRGSSFELVSRCSPVALGNGGGAVPDANPSSSCIHTNDPTDPRQCTRGSDCCSYFCSEIDGVGHCTNPPETLPAGHLADLIDVNGDHIPDIISASYTRVATYELPDGPPLICEFALGIPDCSFCRNVLNDPNATCTGPNGDGEVCCVAGTVTFRPVPGTYCPFSLQHPDGTNDRLVYNVFLGKGDGTFGAAQLWSWPDGWRPGCNDHLPGRNPLIDLNGDGIPDLLHEKRVALTPGGTTYSVEVAYGNGNGFDPTFQADPTSVVLSPGILLFQSPNTTDCTKQFPSFLKDLDGDGLLDFACMQSDAFSPCTTRAQNGPPEGVAFGHGGGFTIFSGTFDTSPVNVAGTLYNFGGTSQIQVFGGAGTRVAQDYLDLNGDGIPERYYLNTPDDPQLHVDLWTPDNDGNGPPGLLYRVENGIGGAITFHYGRTNEPGLVTFTSKQSGEYSSGWGEWIQPSMPFGQWVVKKIEVDSGSDHRETRYFYFDPVVLSDDPLPPTTNVLVASPGRRFRGFQATFSILPANTDENPPYSFERFTYREDPDGLLDYKTLLAWSPTESGYVKQTVDQATYAALSLGPIGYSIGQPFGRFPAPVASAHIECPASNATGACEDIGRRTTTSYTYAENNRLPPPGILLGPRTVLFYTKTATREDSSTADGTPLAREHWFNYSVLSSGTQYLVTGSQSDSSGTPYLEMLLTSTDVTPGLEEGVGTPTHYEEYFYDGGSAVGTCGTSFGATCKGALTKKRVYRDPTVDPITTAACTQTMASGEPVCVDYGSWYDSTTGNRIADVRPANMQAAGGDPSTALARRYIYDTTYSLFPVKVTNELNQVVTRTFDKGTGLKTQEFGPNEAKLTICEPSLSARGKPVCHAKKVAEQRDWTYDGLGRLTSESMPHDDPTRGYVPAVSRLLSYEPFPANVVSEQHAIDWDSCDASSCSGNATLTFRTFDGLDRLVSLQSYTGSGYENHSYQYDARGLVNIVTDPNPQFEDGGPDSVQYRFDHDARGRVTRVVAPGPDQATVLITYGPWEKTVRDADGSINHQVFDGFGELRQVDETGQTPDEPGWAPGNTELATTRYDYDGIGRLSLVIDADGNQTTFTHDGENHRTSITRGSRPPWIYAYDANGGLAKKTDPDLRVTTYSYDAVERVTNEVVADPRLDATTRANLGIGCLHYIYDGDRVGEDINGFSYTNRIGRLAAVEMYNDPTACPNPGPRVPYAAVDYAYDGSGDNTVEQWTLTVPETGPQSQHFNLVRDFGPNGLLQGEIYPNGQSAQWNYDPRAKVSDIEAAGKSVARYGYGLAGLMRSRNALGAVSAEPLQQFIRQYDVRGRVSSEAVQVGSTGVGEGTLNYSPDGDLRGFTVSNTFNGPTFPLTFAFRYDGLHRLRAADVTTPPITNPSCDSLSCGGIPQYVGRFLYTGAGNIIAADVGPDRNEIPNRNVTYSYGDGQNVDAQAVTQLLQSSGTWATFAYDLAGNMTERHTPGWRGHDAIYKSDNNDQIRQVIHAENVGSTIERSFYDHRRHRFLVLRTDASGTSSWRFYLGDEFEADGQMAQSQVREEVYLSTPGESVARLTSTCANSTPSSCQPPSLAVLHHDRRGDLLAALGTDGTVQAQFTYGPFGELIQEFDPNGDWRRRFNGKEQDQVDGLSYYGYRYYDPLTLQWTSSDPLLRFAPEIDYHFPQRLNLYAFEADNPLRYIDPDGRRIVLVINGPPSGGLPPEIQKIKGYVAERQDAGVKALIPGYTQFNAATEHGDKAVTHFSRGETWKGVWESIKAGATFAQGAAIAIQTVVTVGRGGVAEAGAEQVDKEIAISKERFGPAAEHIERADAARGSDVITIERTGADARRAEAMAGKETKSGLDRDEWPPAMSAEGGAGSSVEYIDPKANRGAGACIGNQCRGLPNGSKVRIKVTDKDE
jgi:RHS repeat-associated protein